MSLRPSGFWCDVCNSPMISEALQNKPIKSFKVSCSPTEMHYHDGCSDLIEQAVGSMDETKLPVGSPLGDLLKRVKEHNARVAHEDCKGDE